MAGSKVNFAIAKDVYLLPINMLLTMRNVEGCNNRLLIATTTIKIGVKNQKINMQQKTSRKSPSDNNYTIDCRKKSIHDPFHLES